jgi:hypothetical protein
VDPGSNQDPTRERSQQHRVPRLVVLVVLVVRVVRVVLVGGATGLGVSFLMLYQNALRL